jgi:ribosomal protein S18 acetylase RimI-like enzyme
MSEYYVRHLELAELGSIYTRIERDFAAGEYAPLNVLNKHVQEGIQVGFVLCKGTINLAYSFCASNCANGYVLITLLAVFQEYRGQGIGTIFLKEMKNIYNNKQALLVEVEQPNQSSTLDERDDRLRRIAFYEKAGFFLIKELNYSIWDIPMYLMALPLKATDEIINRQIKLIMYQIYFELLGKRFINKMKFI